ncbi:YIP1 family protein [Gallaecimonas xiamenensis]|uniref:Yip1 domain-containing protein n=1 Tax=Gallaecimonas xiamenensis 3-C-1 TaxID=745411 RepID=K2K1G2_9GAMM|nr:YIP1 family protein [Gallaecimonas xiamenensis]EKE76634.1 hypothetical protein B3C1_03535 [Gallaecimonas xiamenensis 3-C-1]
MQSSSVFGAVIDIFVAPSRALVGVDKNRGWSFLAFVLYALIPALFMAYYFLGNDFEVIKGQMLAAMGDVSPAEREQAAAFFTPMSMTVTTTLMITLVNLIVLTLHGLYLMFATKVDPNNTHGFPDWWALSLWAHLPEILASLLGFVVVMASSTVPDQSQLGLLTLNALLGLSQGDNWFNFASTLSLFTVWTTVLTALGIQLWTQIDKARAWTIALLFPAVVYGGWAVINLIKG